MIIQTKPLGNLNGHKLGSGYAGSVYDTDGLSPTINTMGGGNREPMIVAMRGRNPDNPLDRTAGSPTEHRLEPNSQGICNTLTSAQKDNMVLEEIAVTTRDIRVAKGNMIGTLTANGCTFASHNGSFGVVCDYRIRKLTPLECWRLMGFSDEDFLSAKIGSRKKAKEILEKYPHLGKRAFTEVQRIKRMSNSQLYKQAGNSIVKNVLMAIFGQMIFGKENIYKE